MSKKRELLVDTALRLFYQNGINSIGINEVLKNSGVAKRTLYSHFESKEALILAALEQRHQSYMNWLSSQLADAQNSEQVIENLFNGLKEWFRGEAAGLGDFRGCFFINTSAEFSDPNCAISLYCARHKEEVKQEIGKKLESKHRGLLDAICIMQEGSITTALMHHNGDEVTEKAKRLLLSHCI